MNSQPKYSYEAKGSRWVVYRWEYSGNSASGTIVYESFNREQARKECFRLNGWKYKEPAPVKEVVYKSNVGWEHMPEWLKYIIVACINPRSNIPVADENVLLEEMREEIAESLRKQRIRVPIKVELREDEGVWVLFVKRSGRVLISIYVKSVTS